MNKWDEQTDRVVEEALHSLPLAETPPHFAASVMRQVRAASLPVFRLIWIDLVLFAFVAVMLLVVILIGGSLPPYFDLYIRQEIAYWTQRVWLDPRLAWLALSAAGLILAGTAAGGWAAVRLLEGNERSQLQ